MGFNSVYQNLKELFPQMDARILKAVAIEHSKDPDGAVESILTEVLPFVNMHSHVPICDVKSNGKAVETGSQNCAMLGSTAGCDAVAGGSVDSGHNMNALRLNETLDNSLASSFNDARDSYDNPSGNSKSHELIGQANCGETSAEGSQGTADSLRGDSHEDVCNQVLENNESEGCIPSHQLHDAGADIHFNKSGRALSSYATVEDGIPDVSLSTGRNVHLHLDCFSGLPSHDLNTGPNFDRQKEQSYASFLDCNSLEYQDAAEETSLPVKDHMLDALDMDLPIETLVPVKDHMLDALDLNLPEPENDMFLCHDENQETSTRVDAEFIQESTVTLAVGAEDESVSSTIVTRSGHVCRINLLEDLIENAKGHKDSLSSAMESVIGLMKEVESQEKAAQAAKEDATRGGLKILEKAEELKKMLNHAKEANDMHAGEVYGEKSILATEVKELQTRLLGLSDEKDKSISILDEMQKTLEARLVIAEEERRKAEQEIVEKEASAVCALAEQELIMEKVVEESKLLQLEAEENAKLRDFLMEKGRVVDILQGEISVICQDVKSLKENFDKHASPGKSPLLRQTSSILASSNSSVKSMTSDPGPAQLELLELPAKASRTPSVGSQTPRSSVGEEQAGEAGATPRKELLDEDWELFDF